MRVGARSRPRGKGAGEARSHPPQNRPPFASSARAPCAHSRGHGRTQMLVRTRARPHTHRHTLALRPAHLGRTAGSGHGSQGCAGPTPLHPWLSHPQTVPVGLAPPHTLPGLWNIGTIFREPSNAGSGSPMTDGEYWSAPTRSRAGGQIAPGELLEIPPSLGSISPFALQGFSLKAGVTPFQPLPFHPSCTPEKLPLASDFTTCPPNLTEKDSSAHTSGSLLNHGLVGF